MKKTKRGIIDFIKETIQDDAELASGWEDAGGATSAGDDWINERLKLIFPQPPIFWSGTCKKCWLKRGIRPDVEVIMVTELCNTCGETVMIKS